MNDIVEKVGVSNYYNHKLSLIEFTSILDYKILPDMTITRIEGIYEPTLLDVANKILSVAELPYTVSTYGTSAILDAIPSPEWTFTRMTPLEALRMVFSLAKIVPFMEGFVTLGHVGLSDAAETTKMAPFITRSEGYDPQTFKTALYSNVENFIAGPETLIEPANGWLTPRSPDSFEISNDNLNLGIHEFTHVLHHHSLYSQDASSLTFKKNFQRVLTIIENPQARQKLIKSEYFRVYAFTNSFEFVSVAIEHYFETPNQFKQEFPVLFKHVSRMLNHRH
jgi:hypothetical protein